MKYVSVILTLTDEDRHETSPLGGAGFLVDGLTEKELKRLADRLVFMFRREASQEIEARQGRE